jgi:hypothetical protein
MRKSILKKIAIYAALLVSLAFASVLYAQSDAGSIVGFVRDPTGAVVAGAKVTIKNEGTNEEHPVTTDAQGHYTVPNLLPGFYTADVESAGFKKFESVHNKLDASTTLSLDASLQIGSAAESVEVTATASVLQTESGASQKNITAQQMQAQELNGRNPLYMASLVPGIRSNSTLGDFNFSLSNGGYNVNGTRQNDTLITMDGAPSTRTRGNSTSIGVPNVDATEEIQVLTSSYAAEYGGAGGGQIRIVSKSGTTDFHGSLYEYFRNSAMNANTWSRNLSKTTDFASPFRYNDFGFALGGPIIIPKVSASRQKFFFFVGQEWTRYRYTDTQQQAVPTALMRQGNFSELYGANPWYRAGTVIYQPGTCRSVGNSGCVPYANNTIPVSQLSQNGMAIMNAYPAPTPGYLNGNYNWIAQAAHPINQRKGNLNGDFLLNDANHISFRRTDFSYTEVIPFDQGSGLTPRVPSRPNQTNSLAWTSTISPTMINEARATVSLDNSYVYVDGTAPGFDRSSFGINYPYLLPTGKDYTGKIPTVTVPNFYGLAGGPYPSHSSGPIYTFSDSLTKVWGSHTIKGGFYYEYSGQNDEDQINVSTVPGGASNQNGNFTFTDARAGLGATSGVGLANMALGLADSYTEIGPRAYTAWRGSMYEWFLQDSWKITPKLHIDYGIRDSISFPFHALWGNADFFDPSRYNPANAVQVNKLTGNVMVGTGNQYNGVVIPGLSSFPSSAIGRVPAASSSAYNGLFAPDLPNYFVHMSNAWQPRLGIAYQITPKTVIRAGGGRFQTRMGLLDNIFPGGNSPFQPFVTVNNVSVDNPGASLNASTAAAITMTSYDRNTKPPEVYNWNVTVQRELFWKSVASIAYVGSRGLNEWQVYDINQPTAGALQANPGVNVNYLRPYQGFAAIQQNESAATSRYNSLQLTWSRNYSNGFAFTFSYTLSKSMDNGSNYRDIVPDTYNTSNLWAPSEFDTRHAAVMSYTYDLPFFKDRSKLVGKALGGWQLSGTVQFQTGTPCGIGSNNDYAGVGEYGSFGCGNQGQYWNMSGTPAILGGFGGSTGTGTKWFDTSVFSKPAAGTFNLQQGVRNSIYQPGFQNWNIGLFKQFPINERNGFEFRAEAYDFINHPNWSAPNLNPTSGQFGEITSKTGLSRQLQLSLRYSF